MNIDKPENLFKLYFKESFTINDILQLVNNKTDLCVFIKDIKQKYIYVNNNFCKIIGRSDIIGLTNSDIYKNRSKLNKYKVLDETVIDTRTSLEVCEEIYVNDRAEPYLMKGKLFPLCIYDTKPDAIIGFVSAINTISTLKLEDIFKLSSDRLATYLQKVSYPMKLQKFNVNISKRELQCLFEIMKGRNAGQSSAILRIKQTSVESYINNLKTKLGVCKKNELIEAVIENNLIEQISERSYG